MAPGVKTQGKKKTARPKRKKRCPFAEKAIYVIDYKDVTLLKKFINLDTGKLIPRRVSGASAWHQRQLAIAVKRAREIALLPLGAPR